MTEEELSDNVRTLITAERDTFKTRLGQKLDMEREQIKQLLDIGLAPYIITLDDRRLFADQLRQTIESTNPLGDADVPEEGFQQVPNDSEQNDPDQGESGNFGDMANREYEGEDDYGKMDPERGV
jgi:cobalamin biosynthesis protein CobT